jgi:mono/diheme cytochrome c family protein
LTVYERFFDYLGGKTGLFLKNRNFYLLLIPVLSLMGTLKAFSFPWSFDMWVQPSILPYEEPVSYPDLSVSTTGLRIKPEPREDFESISVTPVPATQESLANGEKGFNIYCFACHGMEGKGDGPVIKRGFYPLNLLTPGVIARTDGYIYAYIRYGGKVMMPSYRESITSENAWDIVNYVRKLQGNPVKETVAEPPANTETPATEDTEQESAE